MDSAVVLAKCIENYGAHEVEAVSIYYGQTHSREIKAAKELAEYFEIHKWSCKDFPLKDFTGGAILNRTGENDNRFSYAPAGSSIAPSWLPARNAIILSALAGYAYTQNCHTIASGVNAVDWSGYPDCTPSFIKGMEFALEIGLGLDACEFKIFTPLIQLSKKEIVEMGESYHVPWNLTWSCYEGKDNPCGTCGACQVRAKGFTDAGIKDPLLEVK
jgi:7-cyano-7-deazaguanine synthase